MENGKYEKVGILNELHAASMLMFIDEHGEVFTTDFLALTGNFDRLKRLADMLVDEGLIWKYEESRPRVRTTYRLTDKGKRVTEKLKEIDEILKEVQPSSSETLLDPVTALNVKRRK